MKKIVLAIVLYLSVMTIFGQTVTLTFTGRDINNQYIRLNRVVVANVTQSWQETIYWPDTTLVMSSTGIADNVANGVFGLAQNNPNPFNGTTQATLNVADAGEVFMELADVNGRVVETWRAASLQMGNHQFRINVSAVGIYFLTACQNGQSSSIKMVNTGSGAANKIEYQDFVNTRNAVETRRATSLQKNNAKGTSTHPFAVGDQMEYVGYAIVNGTEIESQHIQQQLGESQTITLQFDAEAPIYGVPCPGAPTVMDYDNNIYSTLQIGQQCWMKENLRTTHYTDGTLILMGGNSSSSDVAYRYCPGKDTNKVALFGYLYNWKAVMGGSLSSESNPSGVQGICPTGWHVPSNAEWEQLIVYVGSQSQYVCGSDNNNVGKALASTTGWITNYSACAVGNNQISNNATDFSAIPASGYYDYYGTLGTRANFWSATQYNDNTALMRAICYSDAIVNNYYSNKIDGFSVRCLRD